MSNLPFHEAIAMMTEFLLALLVLLFLIALPVYPYSRTWGFYPSGVVSVIFALMVMLLLAGRV